MVFHRLFPITNTRIQNVLFMPKRRLDWILYNLLQVRHLTRMIQPTDEDLAQLNASTSLNGYEDLLLRYNTLVERAVAGGGAKGIERHVHKNKKVLVRDRILMLIDPGTEFFELGTLAGFSLPYGDIPTAGLVSGIGRVAGIYCMIGGNDATVKAGAYFPITVQKSLRMQEISDINRLPSIYIPDSGGAFLPLQSMMFINGGRGFYNQAVMSSKGIPQIAVVCGSCTAGGAYNPTMSDEAVIVDGIGKIFLGGPPLVKAALGEVVTDEELGGAFMHSSVSGCTDYFAENENEAFEMCRDIVEGLNFQEISIPASHSPAYELSSWNYIGSLKHLNKVELYALLGAILDRSQFNEFKAFYGPGIITGIGCIEGYKVGIMANWDEILSPEALKSVHFLDLCRRRGIPVLFLQNSMSPEEEIQRYWDDSVLKDRGKLISAVATLNVPKISLTLTTCHKDDALLLCGPSFNPNLSFMWPSATLHFSDMTTIDENSEEEGSVDACVAAANMLIDNVISPENTRKVIGHSLRICSQMKLNKAAECSNNALFRM